TRVAILTPNNFSNILLEENSGLEGEALSAPQDTVLAAQNPDAEINVRTHPRIDAEVIDAGMAGDAVEVLRIATAVSDDDWYYIRLTNGDIKGWVRADFVEGVSPSTPATAQSGGGEDILSAALDNHCGGPNTIAAYYETASFLVYICTPKGRPIYVSNEIGTSQVLVTEEVQAIEGIDMGYIALQDNYAYHISETELAVYRVDDQGESIPVLEERVTTAKRY
ncbi:MAG: SH3 domain-containing protein, partial [Cyanobacteria bacterium]|nr:SH3 domain-containing protein [Cyanobacteriota bacterium]